MIIDYIKKNLKKANYKILEDGSFYGEIPGFKGVWSQGKTLEKCRIELGEVLEEWLILKIRDNDKDIPGLSFSFENLKLKKQHAC